MAEPDEVGPGRTHLVPFDHEPIGMRSADPAAGWVGPHGTSDPGGLRRFRLQSTTPAMAAATTSPRPRAIQPHGVSSSDDIGSAVTVSAGLVSGVGVVVAGASLVVVGVSESLSVPSATPSARTAQAESSSVDPPDVSVGTVVVVRGSVGAVSVVSVSTSVVAGSVVGAVSVVTVSITVVVAGCVVVVDSVTVVEDVDVVAGDVSVSLGRVGSVSDPVGRVTLLSPGSPDPSPAQPLRR
jgi:hypothetical protein